MDTKQEILNKTESLFMRYGIKSVTMDDIARELGISKKTLYQYVDNKQPDATLMMSVNVQRKLYPSIAAIARGLTHHELPQNAEHVWSAETVELVLFQQGL